MLNDKPIELKIANAAKYLKGKQEAQVIKDIEKISKINKERRINGFRRGQKRPDVQKIAEIPMALYEALPDYIRNDDEELKKWLNTVGKQFKTLDERA